MKCIEFKAYEKQGSSYQLTYQTNDIDSCNEKLIDCLYYKFLFKAPYRRVTERTRYDGTRILRCYFNYENGNKFMYEYLIKEH